MTKTRTTTETETLPDENSPGVVAYRVGKLEVAVTKGFEKLENNINTMTANFATKQEAITEHKAIRADVLEVKLEVDEIKKWKDAIVNKIALFAVIMLVLMVLAMYGLDRFLK